MKQEEGSNSFIDAAKGISEIDYEYVDSVTGGDTELFRQLLVIAEKMIPHSIDKLNNFLSSGDLSGFTIEVHGLKGSLNSIGAQSLGQLAFELEKAAKGGDMPYCKDNIAFFMEKLEAFHQSTAKALRRSAPQDNGMDSAQLLEKLQAAMRAAENFNNTSAFSIIKDLTRRSFGPEIDASLKAVENALDEFECDTAASQLQMLISMIEQRNG